jgi:hypothetical protein
MNTRQDDGAGVSFSRMVDMRIPLWGVMTALAAGIGMAATLWFTTQQLVDSVKDLKIAVNSGNTSVSVLTSELALLKFRVSTHDEELKRLNELQRSMQKGKP